VIEVLILTRKGSQAVMSVLDLFYFIRILGSFFHHLRALKVFLPTQALVFFQQSHRNTSILSSSYNIIQILFFELAGRHHLSLTSGSVLLNLISGRSFKP